MNNLKRAYYWARECLKMWLHKKTMPYPFMLYVRKDGNIDWIHISLMWQQLHSKDVKRD